MNRPKIKIKADVFDIIIEVIGVLGVLFLVGLPMFYYSELPDIIPIHFGFDGIADGFNGKKSIWILPTIGVIIFIGINILNKYPHIFNYPTKITEENAERLYRTACKMVRVLNTLVVCVFAYLTYATIQTALKNQNGLGNYFTTIVMVFIFGIIFYFSKRMSKED